MSKAAQFGALLLSATILLAGNGLQTTLLPLRAEAEEFSALSIGVMGSSYFVGFVTGCLTAAALMRRVGHIRVFTGMAAIASVIPLIHLLALNEWSWWLLRAGTGYCVASLFLVIESWLNERSDNTIRGAVFSIYTSLTFIAIITGQVLLTLYEPTGFAPFVLASIVISLAAVPVALNAIIAPGPPLRSRLRPLKLMRLSPAGTAGCLTAGLVSGAFWSLAPVAASNAGLDARGVAIFIGVTVFGGALSQWPFGRLSDRLDRRVVIVVASVLASAAGFLLFLATQHWSTAVLPLAFAFGAFTFPIYALSVAHANDLITQESFVEVSGGLLFLNGAGAVVGPLAGGLAMRIAGPGALFVAIAIACSLLAVFVLVRMRKVARPPEMHRADSVAAVDAGITAPVSFDPRVGPTDSGTSSR